MGLLISAKQARVLIAEEVFPLAFRAMHQACAAKVKLEASHLIFALIRIEPSLQKRGELCGRIIADFCQARSCGDRLSFLDLVLIIPDVFSYAWTKKHFFSAFMSLNCDPVPSVRRCLATLLPEMYKMVAPAEAAWQVCSPRNLCT